MEALELVKQWTEQEYSKFPKPEFNIGDVVKLIDSDDPDELAVIVGVRLRYFSHMRRHVWYYEIGDHISCPTVTIDWFDADRLEPATAVTDNQKWHVTAGQVPIIPVCECWQCGQIRVDDALDCPYCSADALPF
jgi:hypothetical protein